MEFSFKNVLMKEKDPPHSLLNGEKEEIFLAMHNREAIYTFLSLYISLKLCIH